MTGEGRRNFSRAGVPAPHNLAPQNGVELRSTGQPRAAVPTWIVDRTPGEAGNCSGGHGVLRLHDIFASREDVVPLRMTGEGGGTFRGQECPRHRLVAFVAGALPVDQLADGGAGAGGDGLLVGFDFGARGFFADGADAQADFLFFRAHLDDLEVVLDAGFEMNGLAFGVHRFGLMTEALDAFGDFNECAERGHAQNFALDDVTDVMGGEEAFPDVGLKLLDAERETALIGLDGEDDGFDAIAFLEHFGRMLNTLGPAQVGDVDEAVDAIFDFEESAEVGEIADPAFNGHADGEFLVERVPRVGGELAHAERDAALGGIHIEHNALDVIADVDQLRGMLHALRPGHFAHVDEALDALLEFDESSVIGDTDDAAGNVRADRITMLGIEPGIGRELLEAQRHALLVFIVFENLNLNLIADVDEVFGVSETSPGHVGNVEKSVEAERSTNAPYSVRFLTTPVRMVPSSRCSRVLERFSFCSPSSNSLRETTMLPRFLLSLMTATSMVWPFMASRLRMGRRSTWEPGRKAWAP